MFWQAGKLRQSRDYRQVPEAAVREITDRLRLYVGA